MEYVEGDLKINNQRETTVLGDTTDKNQKEPEKDEEPLIDLNKFSSYNEAEKDKETEKVTDKDIGTDKDKNIEIPEEPFTEIDMENVKEGVEEVKVELPSKEERVARQQMSHKDEGAEGPKAEIRSEEAGTEAIEIKPTQEIPVEQAEKEPRVEAKPNSIIEAPIVSEYAQNNYWRTNMEYNINQLEAEYA